MKPDPSVSSPPAASLPLTLLSLKGRRFKELFVLTISPVLPGGFSISRTGQPKLPLLPEVGTEPEYIYVNDRARKESIFVLAQMDISRVTQAGHVQKAHLGKTKL